ncbi:hypothetical protein ACH5RR_011809 [Cinchona calisaya]|uniref:Uncharacterized protein n=1 Tax=Cinchona calisaya TaxID=153742 RepID=A0ABD3A7J3_9GENT
MDCFSKLVKKINRTPMDAINSLLEELDRWWTLELSADRDEKAVYEKIQILTVELRFFKMFLISVGNCCNPDKGCVFMLRSLVLDLEVAFKEARIDFRVAHQKGFERRAEYLDPTISKWQQKLTLFRPLIKAAYDYVLPNKEEYYYSFQSHSTCPLNNYVLWDDFCSILINNLMALSYGKATLVENVMPQLRAMEKMLVSLKSFIRSMGDLRPKENEYRDVLTHFGAVLARAAQIYYLCWIDGIDENMTQEMTIKLFDLLKKLKPNTPQVTEVCLNVLKALYSSNHEGISQKLSQFLIPDKDRLRILRKEVEYLITLAIDPPHFYKEDDAKLLLMDVTAVVSELGSFSYLFHAEETIAGSIIAKESYHALFKFLEKMELLNAELFLIELLGSRVEIRESYVKDRMDSFHDGLSFLQIFLGDGNNNNISKPIWTNIGSLARNAGSVYLSSLPNYDEAQDQLLKFLQKTRLLKMGILLEELLDSCPNLRVNVKNQVETLHQGLSVLKTFLMGPLDENGKLILAHVESVVSDTVSVYCSFDANKVTEDNARSIVSELVERIEPVTAEIRKIYLCIRSSSRSNFPKTNHGFGFMDFLLGNLMDMLNSKADSIAGLRYQIQAVHGEIGFLRSLLWNIQGQWTEHLNLKKLVSHIMEVAYEVEYLVDSFVVRDGVLWYHALWILDLMEDIKLIKSRASEITMKTHGISIHNDSQASRKVILPAKIPKIYEAAVVDLTDQNKLIIDRLTRGSLQQDVVSIVGMPGLGKTTLARKVCHDPLVTCHFHILAWCCVSPVYRKRDVLLEILGDIVDLTDNILEMSDEDLNLELYRKLRKKRYLIVMDDLWRMEAWSDLKRTFPDDKNGSRILITSRHPNLALKIKADSIPHRLRLLSDDESWKMLQHKLFQTRDCPVELATVGNQIAKGCEGLPLAVVAISGLLERTEMIPEWWKQVAESLCTRIADDPQSRCMDILELSYKHLPDYLKPCFLYLGAFLDNKEIPVRKLTCLWVAEGFIKNAGQASMEDLAEEYLRDLIGRSLVMAAKRSFNGGVKTCRVHDMLRTLCLKLCKEDNFLQCITGNDIHLATSYEDTDYGVDPSYCYPSNSIITYEKRRLSIYSKRNHFVMSRPCGPHVRSLLYSASSDLYPRCPYDISFISDNFKLLRVLDMECMNMGISFPIGVVFLVHLRYLALCGDIDCIPVSIANLWNLETLFVKGLKGKVVLPDTIWNMANLRHVHVHNSAAFRMQETEMKNASQLENLVSLSSPFLACGKHTEEILRRLPKLRKLRCHFAESQVDVGNYNQFPILNFLTELESLKVLYSGRNRIAHPCEFDFPLKLRKLSLSRFSLPWDCISEIGRLPNLEVLKLLSKSFEGKVWDMKEGEFLKLKFLKLDTLNIAEWNASSDNLPNLQHLILRNCRHLEVVPSDFGYIPTLEMIEVQLCRRSAEDSVRRLEEEQLEMGNDELKVLINHSDWDF